MFVLFYHVFRWIMFSILEINTSDSVAAIIIFRSIKMSAQVAGLYLSSSFSVRPCVVDHFYVSC